jgi:hypothetical protein
MAMALVTPEGCQRTGGLIKLVWSCSLLARFCWLNDTDAASVAG